MTARLSLGLRHFELIGIPILATLVAIVGTLLAYAAGPTLPIALAVGLVGAYMAFSRPIAALCIAIALVPFELASITLGGVGITPTEGLLALTAIGWTSGRLVRGEAPWVPSRLGKPLFALVFAMVPGLAFSPDPFAIVKTLVFYVFFLLIYQMIVADGRVVSVRWIMLVLAVSGAVVGAYAYLRSGGQQQQLVGFGDIATGRATGSFEHPNTLASFEALALPAALALGLGGSPRVRPIALVAFAVTLTGLALSLSRGGLLAVAGALLVMLLWRPFRWAALASVAVVLLFAVTGSANLGQSEQIDVVTQRLSSVGYSAEGVDVRFQIWKATPKMIADHPVFGVGENQYSRFAPDYGLVNINASGTFEHAHDVLLTITAELGFIGLAALLWLVVSLARVLWRAVSRPRGGDRGLAFAVLAGFFAVALQGVVDYTLRSNVIAGSLFVLAGCAAVLDRRATRDGPAAQPLPSRS